MVYIETLWIIIMLIESYDLYQKKLKKTSLKIFLYTIVKGFLLLILSIPAWKKEYSFTIYMLQFMRQKPFFYLAYLGINGFIFYQVVKNMIKLKKKKKQNKKMLIFFFLFGTLAIMITIFYLFHNIAPWLILILCIFLIGTLVKYFCIQRKGYQIIGIGIVCLCTFYFFFTDIGASRLHIALLGYPLSAYETGFEELKYLKEENVKKYYPIKKIPLEEEDMGILIVKNYMGIKIAKHMKNS